MPGLFGIYEVGRRSLQAYQSAINAIGHNVANAGTPGFHRQRVQLAATAPIRDQFSNIGTGVTVATVQRVEDRFIESAILRELPVLAGFAARADVLAQAELTFSEPSEGGLTGLLDDFYDAWDDLASSPEDAAVRESVVRRGVTVADTIRASRTRLLGQMQATNGEIAATVDDTNRLLRELAGVNRSILVNERAGQVAPDLEDRRDLIVEGLAELSGATSAIEPDGTATVWIAERVALQGEEAQVLTFDASGNESLRVSGLNLEQANRVEGRLGGLLRTRDEDLSGALARLDAFASRLAADVNAVHRTGIDDHGRPAGDFFVLAGVGADGVAGASEHLQVAGTLVRDPAGVAAGRAGAPGDGSLALDIAALRNDPRGASGLLQNLIVDLGSRSREAQDLLTGQRLVVDSFVAQRESVSGVSLDEEAANLLRFQRSYEAAARVLTTADEMVQILLQL